MPEAGFERRGEGIGVELPQLLRGFVKSQAAKVSAVIHNPSDDAYMRLCGPINVSVDVDDPIRRLERQLEMEAMCAMVELSAHKEVLTENEAEAWLRVLTMSLARAAAYLGIGDEEALEELSPVNAQYVGLLQALQFSLVEALEEGEEEWGETDAE